MTAAVVQMCSGPDVSENLHQVEQLLHGLNGSADLIVLPECFAQFGGDIPALGNNTTEVRDWLATTASKESAWLVAGSIPYTAESHKNPKAACFVFSPEGKEVCRYDKIHLFDVDVSDNTSRYRESDDYSAGKQVQVVDMGFAKTGLSICYDVRFPELYQQLRHQGAGIITVPSAFTKVTGKAHWESLLRARAIETQCFILAANQGGVHPNNRETWGHSMVISPWGEVLAEAGEELSLMTVELDLAQIERVRQQIPCFEHKVI
ncbi:carbon-nitrogen hydrolase [Endozoicomonas sp. OPT23]|nr:carbon-nitrogen hydrolase [Endozoicomonas sp. OPT23]